MINSCINVLARNKRRGAGFLTNKLLFFFFFSSAEGESEGDLLRLHAWVKDAAIRLSERAITKQEGGYLQMLQLSPGIWRDVCVCVWGGVGLIKQTSASTLRKKCIGLATGCWWEGKEAEPTTTIFPKRFSDDVVSDVFPAGHLFPTLHASVRMARPRGNDFPQPQTNDVFREFLH